MDKQHIIDTIVLDIEQSSDIGRIVQHNDSRKPSLMVQIPKIPGDEALEVAYNFRKEFTAS